MYKFVQTFLLETSIIVNNWNYYKNTNTQMIANFKVLFFFEIYKISKLPIIWIGKIIEKSDVVNAKICLNCFKCNINFTIISLK